MKQLFRSLLCAGVLALGLTSAVSAAEPVSLPEKQGDFYVMVDGDFVSFSDAVPQIREERSFLPFVAVFEQLGFAEEDMTWDGSTGTVTATKADVLYTPFSGGERRTGDVTVTLTIGDRTIQVAYSGDTTADSHGHTVPVSTGYDCDVAPYIDPATSRTYIPFGLVADALGYQVGWDGQVGCVIIDDVDKLIAQNTETYRLMNQYLDYARSVRWDTTRTQGTLAVTNCTSTWKGENTETMEVFFQGQFDQFASSAASEIIVDAEMSVTMDTTAPSPAHTQTSMLLDMEVIQDLAAGVQYINAPALTQFYTPDGGEDVWYRQPQTGSLTAMSPDLLTDLNHGTWEEFLRSQLEEAQVTSIDYTARDVLAAVNSVYGDSAFVQIEENAYQCTAFPGKFVLYTSSDTSAAGYEFSLTGATMTYTMWQKGPYLYLFLYTEVNSGPSYRPGVGTGSFQSMEIEMRGTLSQGEKSPNSQPPAGAVIRDAEEMNTPLIPAS